MGIPSTGTCRGARTPSAQSVQRLRRSQGHSSVENRWVQCLAGAGGLVPARSTNDSMSVLNMIMNPDRAKEVTDMMNKLDR